MQPNRFRTESGFEFPAISLEQTEKARASLLNELKLTQAHITEAASYSLAMVARFALGLSADQADVCVFANDTLCGAVALAAVRHLSNAGSHARIFIESSNELRIISRELEILSAMEIPVKYSDYKNGNDLEEIERTLAASHNAIFGVFNTQAQAQSDYGKLVELLNEARTPIHCLDCPLGINPDSGSTGENVLFASSTLSLGTVLSGTFRAHEQCGRHYICDISITKKLYSECGHDLTPLFSEQPVVKIFPVLNQEAD